MGCCDCEFLYDNIFDTYLKNILSILLTPSGTNRFDLNNPPVVLSTNPYSDCHLSQQTGSMLNEWNKSSSSTISPYEILNHPIESKYAYEDAIAHTKESYNCLIITNLKGYYFSGSIIDEQNNNDQFVQLSRDSGKLPTYVGCFIVPEFGAVQATTQYLQTIAISFDSNYENDAYGTKQLKMINWFVNEHTKLKNDDDKMTITTENGDNVRIFANVANITGPLYNDKSGILVRRTVTIRVRYCLCNQI